MFIADLWESVFTPGTTPALMTATHASFIMLILSLLLLIAMTQLIHFVILLTVALCLYAAVVWFVSELKNIKLLLNIKLNGLSCPALDTTAKKLDITRSGVTHISTHVSSSKAAQNLILIKKRKV